jgi:hypothetical protein
MFPLLCGSSAHLEPLWVCNLFLPSIGAGLLTTFTPHISDGKWIGYQILWAVECGMSMFSHLSLPFEALLTYILGMQQASLAAQSVLSRQDAPIGISLVFFAQSLGGAVFLSVDQAIYSNKLTANLGHIANVAGSEVTSILEHVSPQDLPHLLNGYNGAVMDVFRVALAASCACVATSALMEWKSVKAEKGSLEKPAVPDVSGTGEPKVSPGMDIQPPMVQQL